MDSNSEVRRINLTDYKLGETLGTGINIIFLISLNIKVPLVE
jgi:hypothetical protein